MFDKALKRVSGITTIAVLGIGTAFGQAAQGQAQPGQAQPGTQDQAQPGQAAAKKWKDQAEYDLFASITKETDPSKKLGLLNNWKDKYSTTDFKQERLQLYLTTYQQSGQPQKMVETAKEMLTNDPKDFQALYWLTFLTPTLTTGGPPSADTLDMGEKAATSLTANLDETFSAAKKPASTSDADWKKARNDMEALAHKTLGWTAMQRKDNAKAEDEFTKSLQLNSNAGEVSYWLGTVILAEKKPERQAAALYHFARAAAYEGQGALTPQGRQQIDQYLTKAYTTYHGNTAGLNELRAQAKGAVFPPADYKIKSTTDLEAEKVQKEEEFKKSNPQLALWVNIKNQLTGPNGDQYFNSSMKGAAVPRLRGALISQQPAVRPKELVLGISDPNTPEVTLRMETPLPGKAEPGTQLEFEGVPRNFSKEPFMVTFDVDNARKISGWPVQAASPARARPAARRGGARRRR